MEPFLETTGEISRTGKAHFKSHIRNTAKISPQHFGRPLEPEQNWGQARFTYLLEILDKENFRISHKLKYEILTIAGEI